MEAVREFFSRLRWCWLVLKGKKCLLLFPRLDGPRTTMAAKQGQLSYDDWQAMAELTEECAHQRFLLDIEEIEDAAWQDLLLAEAHQILETPRPC